MRMAILMHLFSQGMLGSKASAAARSLGTMTTDGLFDRWIIRGFLLMQTGLRDWMRWHVNGLQIPTAVGPDLLDHHRVADATGFEQCCEPGIDRAATGASSRAAKSARICFIGGEG